MFSIFRRYFCKQTQIVQKISEVNLVGRDFISPKNLIPSELKSLIWTAIDLQRLWKQKCLDIKLDTVNVTSIFDQSYAKSQLPLANAARLLKFNLNTIVDPCWKQNYTRVDDFGRMLSISSDIIFCKNDNESDIEQIADGSPNPVISIKTADNDLIKTLANLMTLQLHFGRLRNLTLAWVGCPLPILNTYFCLLPTFGINIKYFLTSQPDVKVQCYIDKARKLSQHYCTTIQECSSAVDTVYRSDVIATRSHKFAEHQIKMNHLQEAAVSWALLHDLPRGDCELEDEVFKHENCLVWKSINNLQWIYAAIIVRFLCHYDHKTNVPSFDGASTDFFTKIVLESM